MGPAALASERVVANLRSPLFPSCAGTPARNVVLPGLRRRETGVVETGCVLSWSRGDWVCVACLLLWQVSKARQLYPGCLCTCYSHSSTSIVHIAHTSEREHVSNEGLVEPCPPPSPFFLFSFFFYSLAVWKTCHFRTSFHISERQLTSLPHIPFLPLTVMLCVVSVQILFQLSKSHPFLSCSLKAMLSILLGLCHEPVVHHHLQSRTTFNHMRDLTTIYVHTVWISMFPHKKCYSDSWKYNLQPGAI